MCIRDREKVLSVDADLVITKRRFVNISSERYILHKGFIFLVRLLFPSLRKISDFQSGVKVVKRSKVISVADELISNDLLFDVNIIYAFKRRGYTIKEVEIQYLNDEDGSKIGKSLSKTIVLMALSLLRLRIFYSPFKKLLYYPLMVRFQRWVFNRLNS
nr:hypothetical protein [Sulfolobus acidocaldarius]